MKIVHCILSFNTGGAETMLVDILNEQIKKVQSVSLLILNNSVEENLLACIDKRVEIIRINRVEGSRSLAPFIRLNREIRKQKADIVHLHNALFLRLLLPFVAKTYSLTIHALDVPLKFLSRLRYIFAISEAVAEDVKKRYGRNSIVISNGIVVESIEPRTNVSSFLGEKMRIVNVARLYPNEKGQDILIKALSILKKKGYSDIELDFIGKGPSEEALRTMAQELGVGEQVHFLGLRDRAYIYSHLKNYDLMCHPSRFEGFGLTVAEGIAAKLPLLVSSGGGPEEILQYGVLGYIFENGDAEDCANKLEDVYLDYSQALDFVTLAYNEVKNKYTVEKMVKEYIKVYQA